MSTADLTHYVGSPTTGEAQLDAIDPTRPNCPYSRVIFECSDGFVTYDRTTGVVRRSEE